MDIRFARFSAQTVIVFRFHPVGVADFQWVLSFPGFLYTLVLIKFTLEENPKHFLGTAFKQKDGKFIYQVRIPSQVCSISN